ncbi:hypothetical protein V8C44DRAFT_339025 [Trichoderma aethiopicum]
MQPDIEAALEAVDRQDHIPGPEDQSNQDQDQEQSIRAVIYATTAGHSSTRPSSIASTQIQDAIRERHNYQAQLDIAGVRAQDLPRLGTFEGIMRRETAPRSASPASLEASIEGRPRNDAARRANPPGTEDNAETEDESLAKFLIEHQREDIFNLETSVVSLRSFLKSVGYDIENFMKGYKPKVTMKLSLAALNRMRMRRLQIELANRIMRMHYFGEMPEDWETLLQQYIAATRDNDYIRACVDRGLHDPFLIRSERMVDAAILNRELSHIPSDRWEKDLFLQFENEKERFNFVPPLEREPTAIGGTRTAMTRKQWTEDFLRRIVLSVVGGAFLVVPMWLMIKLNSQSASLITTTVFVFVSGIAAAYALDNAIAVISTTAAYAAVLVVFVGTNSSPTPS